MKPLYILSTLLFVAACDVPNTPASPPASPPAPQSETPSAPQGNDLVQIVDGRNCLDKKCFRFDKWNRSVTISGRYPVSAPRDIDLRDGYVTRSEFSRMYADASRAYSRGAGSR